MIPKFLSSQFPLNTVEKFPRGSQDKNSELFVSTKVYWWHSNIQIKILSQSETLSDSVEVIVMTSLDGNASIYAALPDVSWFA